MRSSPSGADLDLLAYLKGEGLSATPTQLERWRARGLLPRSRVAYRGWGGSQVLPHDEVTREIASVLADISTRGRPWQFGGIVLFEDGLPIAQDALRRCAQWLFEKDRRRWRRIWHEAQDLVATDPEDPLGEVTDIAFTALELGRHKRLTPRLQRAVLQQVRHREPYFTRAELHEATERSTGWRVADMLRPDILTERERRLARYGTEDLQDPGVLRSATPSEAMECAKTITSAEAYLYRRVLVTLMNAEIVPMQPDRNLLDLAVWDVCEARLNRSGVQSDTGRPLSQDDLDEMYEFEKQVDWEQSNGIPWGQLTFWADDPDDPDDVTE